MLYPQGVSLFLKNAVKCLQRAVLPSPLHIVMAIWSPFLKFELAGSGVGTRWRL